MNTVAFTGYRPEKMPFSEDEEDESYIRFREQQHIITTKTDYKAVVLSILGFNYDLLEKVAVQIVHVNVDCTVTFA